MNNNEKSPEDIEKNALSSIRNLKPLLDHPNLNYQNLTWDQVHFLQKIQYPETINIQRNLLVLPYPVVTSTQEHNHTFFEMTYVISGNCTQHTENHYMLLNEGDFCILPPGMSHTLFHNEESKVLLILVRDDTMKSLFPFLSTGQDMMSNFFHDIMCKDQLSYFLLFHTEKDAYIRHGLLTLKEEMTNNDVYSDRIALAKLSDLLLHMNRICQNVELSPGENFADQDQQILSMIYEQYATITLSQLAEALHYSIPYCSKYLKKNLGCTFSELIQKVRFQQAKTLLENSNLPVNQIGKNIGYETPENFFRAFKKAYGITPSQYRKEKCGDLKTDNGRV